MYVVKSEKSANVAKILNFNLSVKIIVKKYTKALKVSKLNKLFHITFHTEWEKLGKKIQKPKIVSILD